MCTSSNAATVLEWAFERGRRVLFFPDQHLGRNTAKAMGVPLEQMPMWNPRKALGGNDAHTLLDAKVILWHGFCSVHKRFTVAQIEKARAEHPGVRILAHPECPMPVVDAADEAGSTDYIQKAVAAAPAGSVFAIATEINMVNRLAAQYPEHTIFCLDPVICPCSTMYRIHPGYLAWVLEALVRRGGAEPDHRARRGGRRREGGPGADAGGTAVNGTELVVVGSGVAGLYAALTAAVRGLEGHAADQGRAGGLQLLVRPGRAERRGPGRGGAPGTRSPATSPTRSPPGRV